MLTDFQLRSLKSEGTQRETAVGGVPGLSVRANQSDNKTFFLSFRAPSTGKPARMRLGEYDPQRFTLAMVRELARGHRALLDRGIDPREHLREVAERQARELEQARRAEAERNASTFAAAAADYVAKFQVGKKQNRTWKETERLLRVNCAKWQERPIFAITRREIHDLLDGIMAAGKGYSANRTYASLKTFFRWCASRDLIAIDPMQGVERPFDGEAPRDRAWSDDEVARLWRAADRIGGNAGAALKVLLLMGARRDEVFHLRWSEIEAEGRHWRLSLARSKNRREHVFPLPALVRRIIAAQPRSDGCDLVFPTAGGKPIVHWTGLKGRVQKLSGVADFTFHQSRHTFRTALDRLGVQPHVKDQCLNHAPQHVGDRHYSHHAYLAEQLDAFERWAETVEHLVWGKDVVPLRG